MAQYSDAPADPYRVLFQHLSAGAARCRLIVERDDVIAVDVIDRNAAFEAVHHAVPQLHGFLSQARRRGAPATTRLDNDGAALAVAAYPVTGDELMLVIEDVTARALLEQRSRDSQVRFEQAFHGNAAAMVIASPTDLRIIDVNPRWLELFGASRDAVIGRTATELGLITPDRARARIAEHRRLDGGYDVELELQTIAGAGVTVLASARPIDIPEGRCTLTTLIDITARKHAEEAFAIAFSASPAGMILVDDASDRVVTVNDRMLEMTGRRRDDLVGRRTHELALVNRPTRDELVAEIERAGRLDGVEVELTCTHGSPVHTLASTERIMMHGKVHRLSVFTDITARKRAEDALRELNLELEGRVRERTAALETSNRDLEAFSSSVSHDLRAPLRAMHGFSAILLEDFARELPDDARGLLDRIHTSSSRLRDLVEDLLGYARFGRGELHRRPVELEPLVRAVIDELVAGRGLGDRLELRVLSLGSCHADPALLRTVWMNLLDNALKYARDRERIRIEVGREDRGGEVVYYVRDNGVGFDMEQAHGLFGVFQRLHPASEFEGTGIGLANVRRIIERHHGRVAARSELGRGSTFEFTLGPEVT